MKGRGSVAGAPVSTRRIAGRGKDDHGPAGLEQLAGKYGVQIYYNDMQGRRHRAVPKVLRALLERWSVPADSPGQIRDSLREYGLRRSRRPSPPVVVCWRGTAAELLVRLPAHAGVNQIAAAIVAEDGSILPVPERKRWKLAGSTRADGAGFDSYRVKIPDLPVGYHRLSLDIEGCRHTTLLISAPKVSFPGLRKDASSRNHSSRGLVSGAPVGAPLALFVPLYAVHSRGSWGAGSFADGKKLATLAAANGYEALATLPLLATFVDGPATDPSPYSPVSRMFWNEFYLHLPDLPEFAGNDRAQKLFRDPQLQTRLQGFRDSDLIDYRQQAEARRAVLWELARAFFNARSPRRERFEEFLRAQPLLADYAEFRAALEQSGTAWRSWDARLKFGKIQAEDYSIAHRNYHLYAQWAAGQQMNDFLGHARGRGVRLYLDLPVGVNPDGYDAWRFRGLFADGVRTGAPPDVFFTGGQDWGFAPPDPHAMREQRYQYVRDFLSFQMQHCDLLRIDHVMGLHRLFWIPPGFDAAQGVYVSYPAEELYAVLCLESHRHSTAVVGENLGTVPAEVNASMERHGLAKMYVLQFEQRPDPKKAMNPPPPGTVASLNTHDTATFAAHLAAADVDLKAELRLIPQSTVRGEKAARKRLNESLVQFLHRKGYLQGLTTDSGEIVRAALRYLASSAAALTLVNLEDLWSEPRPQNVPGTSFTQRPNWQRKAAKPLEAVEPFLRLK